MATLLLTAVGTALGGPLGGALGALAGRSIDSVLIGSGSAKGPRLQDLSVQSSTYGAGIPLHFGRMRAAGTVIWATDLVEHTRKQGGKGRPTVTTYTYTASFAVALSSRPISRVGRIWADGNLLRGEAGDLKVAGTLRVLTGHGDQPQDSLMVQAEGVNRCPAYRQTALAVFEDLALGTFGNRIPSLTFEIIADDGTMTLADIVAEIAPGSMAARLDQTLDGFSVDRGSAADTLDSIAQAIPLTCSVLGDTIMLASGEQAPGTPPQLPEPAAGGARADAVRASGWSRKRDALPTASQCGVRYYDTARDYQPGLQQGLGRSAPGGLTVVELPAAISAAQARQLAEAAGKRLSRAPETLRYRITRIDTALRPGAIVTVPVAEGLWRIDQWEWQADGVLLDLIAVPAAAFGSAVGDPGRNHQQVDLLPTATVLAALELPWDGTGNGDTPALFAAATGATAGWTGAALFLGRSDGGLDPLDVSTRTRAVLGTARTALLPASPHFIDRINRIEIDLAGSGLSLVSSDYTRLMQGANRALLGQEFIQFATIEWVTTTRIALSDLLRGRGGTEWAISGHAAGDRFILLDDALVALDGGLIGDAATATIAATGLGDHAPALSTIADAGITRRPYAPVAGRMTGTAASGWQVKWTRRARGSLGWLDVVEVPLNEQAEMWDITFGNPASPAMRWQTTSPQLQVDATTALALVAGGGPQQFVVRQLGSVSASMPLAIPVPA